MYVYVSLDVRLCVCVCVCMTNEAKDEARGGLCMLDAETQEGMTSACSSGSTASVSLPVHLHAIRSRIAGIANATIELNPHKRHPNAYITTHKLVSSNPVLHFLNPMPTSYPSFRVPLLQMTRPASTQIPMNM